MSDLSKYEPAHPHPHLGERVFYRNKGLGAQAVAWVTRTRASTLADPDKFLPELPDDSTVDLVVEGPNGTYREHGVKPGTGKGTWTHFRIPAELLNAEIKPKQWMPDGLYISLMGTIVRAEGDTLTVTGGRWIPNGTTYANKRHGSWATLEPYTPPAPPKPTFKVGDRVVLRDATSMTAKPGATATVDKVDDRFVYVTWDRTNDLDNNQMNGGYYPPHFDLAPTPPPVKPVDDGCYQPGDIIRRVSTSIGATSAPKGTLYRIDNRGFRVRLHDGYAVGLKTTRISGTFEFVAKDAK